MSSTFRGQTMTRVCVVGAGAVGGYVGAHTTHAGVDTVLVDAWPEHVLAMREHGLKVSGMNGAGSVATPVRALHVGEVQQLVRCWGPGWGGQQ